MMSSEYSSLVAETDPKYGLHAVARRLQDLSDVAHGLDGHLGVAGAVAQEEAVVLRLVERVVPGHDVDAGAALHEAADLVDLETAVHGAYAGEPRGVHGVGSLRGEMRDCKSCTIVQGVTIVYHLGGDLRHYILLARIKLLYGVGKTVANHNLTQHSSVLPAIQISSSCLSEI